MEINETHPSYPVGLPEDAKVIGNHRSKAGNRWFEIDLLGEVFIARRDDVFRACSRCGGCGHFSYCQTNQTWCFGCEGSGAGDAIDWNKARATAKRRITDRARAARKAAETEARITREWAEWTVNRSGMIEFLNGMQDATGFLGDMARKVANRTPLSEKMEAAVLKIMVERQARQADAQAAGHWGEVGKRAEATVAIKSARPYESEYGTKHLVIMTTEAGQILKVWASGEFGWTAAEKVGETITIKATVKAHGDYKGTPETMVQRVVLVG